MGETLYCRHLLIFLIAAPAFLTRGRENDKPGEASRRRGLLDDIFQQMHSLQTDVEKMGLGKMEDEINGLGLSVDTGVDDYILEQENNGTDGSGALPADFADQDNITEVEVNDAAHVSGYLFSGDMRVTKEQRMDLESVHDEADEGSGVSLDAVKAKLKRWPGAVIPYTFSPSFTAAGRAAVFSAIREYRQRTCIRFVPRRGQYNYVEFINGRGCWSWAGMQGRGKQRISLQNIGCTRKGIAIHEMMHALGYEHEHTRPDRDRFIQIMWNNIRPEGRAQFSIYKSYSLAKSYDYNSIMHYPSRAFSKNRWSRTIIPRRWGVYIGQRWGLSRVDALSINKLYCRQRWRG